MKQNSKNHRRGKSNFRFKRFWGVFLVLAILCIGSVSSFEFDNVKEYNPELKEITITNALGLGDDIATIKLDTPLVYNVIRGEDRLVAEFTINNFNDYSNVFNAMEFYDVRKDMKKFDREFNYKYKTFYDVGVIDYETICKERETWNKINKTFETEKYDCIQNQIGLHIEERFEWNDFNEKTRLLKGEIIIGIFTDVSANEKVEWIPTLFGVKINEWAFWTESLNVDLKSYWDFSETSGTNLPDVVGGIYNGTAINMEDADWVAGKIGNALDFDGIAEYINFSDVLDIGSGESQTISMWINSTSIATRQGILNKGTSVGSDYAYNLEILTSSFETNLMQEGAGGIYLTTRYNGTTALGSNNWYHVVSVFNSTADTLSLYVNGSHVITDYISAGTRNANSVAGLQLGRRWNDVADYFHGMIDEVGIWNRSLSQTEITQLYNEGTGVTYSGTFPLEMKTSLISPDNLQKFVEASNVNFNGSVTPNLGNITNATLYIWDIDGSTILNQTTNLLTGDVINSTTWNVSVSQIGNHNWNIEGCGSNITDYVCTFALTNRTFQIQSFSEVDNIFTNYVYETSNETFGINITTISTKLSINSNLNYDGITYPSTVTCVNESCNIINTIDIPLIQNITGENKTFYWEVFIFDGSSSIIANSSFFQQNVSGIHLEQCNATYLTKTLNFTTYDEQNLSRLSQFQFDGTFDFWIGSGTIKKNNSFSKNISEMNLCLSPNATMKIDAIIDYDEVGNTTDYTNRFYYFDTYPINNVTQHINMYLLKSASATSFILKVQDENLLPVADALIEIHKYYPGEGIYRIVQIAKTDDNGKSVGFFQTETIDYKFIIKKSGETLLETGKQKVIPEVSPFTLTFNTGTDLGEPWSSQNSISNLESSLSWDADTGFVTYSYIDSSDTFTQARLFVQEQSLANSTAYSLTCNDTSSLSSSTMICNVGNESGFYVASAYITRTGEALDLQITFQIETFSSVAGFLGLFFGWFLILIASFLFKFNEIAGIWATTVTIFLVNLIGLIKFGAVFVTAILGIAIILTWVMEK